MPGKFYDGKSTQPFARYSSIYSSIILKELGQLELAKKHFEDAITLNHF